MRGRVTLTALCAVALLGIGAPVGAATRDDTDSLQARLDAGGTVFLPRLAGGACYATRGLWVSRDDTRITSDGACIVALGRGPARLDPPGAKRPHYANAVFYVTHSSVRAPVPARVSISGLRITVPRAKRMHGIALEGHEVTLSRLTIGGAPLNAVLIGGGVAGAGGAIERIALTDSTLSGAQRDVVRAFGPIGLRIEGNTVRRGTGAGIHIVAADRGQPVVDTHVVRNVITDNGGAGIHVDLDPPNGAAVLAAGIEISGNQVLRNARSALPKLRGGIVVTGKGEVVLAGNVLRRNRGRPILTRGARTLPRPPPQHAIAPASTGDDTAWLQGRLDRGGGTIFLPKLPGDLREAGAVRSRPLPRDVGAAGDDRGRERRARHPHVAGSDDAVGQRRRDRGRRRHRHHEVAARSRQLRLREAVDGVAVRRPRRGRSRRRSPRSAPGRSRRP